MSEEIVEFLIPLRHEDLEDEQMGKYYVMTVLEVASANQSILQGCLTDVEESLEEKAYLIHKHENFDTLYSMLKHFSLLSDDLHLRVIELLISGLNSLLQSIGRLLSDAQSTSSDDHFEVALKIHRNALKMYVYLIHWTVSLLERAEIEEVAAKAAKKKTKGSRRKETIGIDSWKERMIKSMSSVFDYDLGKLWRSDRAEDSFLLLFFNIAYSMLENGENIKSKSTTASVFQLITVALSSLDSLTGAVSAIVNMILKYEHMADTVVDLLETMAEENSNRADPQNSVTLQFTNEIFIEIGKLENEDLNMDKSATTHLSNFITLVGDRIPRSVLHNISVLMVHLNDESYVIRNSIVHALSRVVAQILTKDNSEIAVKARDDLLGILEERFRDSIAYTRSKVIQCWSYLCEERALPLKLLPDIIALVRGRLHDKSAFVRKAAVQFLSNILDNNPYITANCGLRRSHFADELAKVDQELVQVDKIPQSILKKHLSQKAFLSEALRAIDQLQLCLPLACELLHTATSSDVTECIDFLARTYLSQIDGSEQGIKYMMKLIWSNEQSIKEAVLNAFEQLFLSQRFYKNPEESVSMARKLILLVRSCTQQEVTALEAIVTLCIQKDLFPKKLFLALLELYKLTDQVPDPTESDCSGAAIILRMIANARPSALRQRIKTLVRDGLGERAEKHVQLAIFTCDILERLAIDDSTNAEVKKKQDDEVLIYTGGQANFKVQHDNVLFLRLAQLLCLKYYSIDEWVPFADRAIRCIFALCDRPLDISQRIITQLARRVSTTNENISDNQEDVNMGTEDGTAPLISTQIGVSIPDLTKLFFVLGHSALKELVLVESQHKLAKKHRQLSLLEAENKQSKASKSKKGRRKKKDDSDDEETAAKSTIEAELGLDPNNLEDHELDETFEERERMILGPQSIYMQYAPLIQEVCRDYYGKTYSDPSLRTHAIFALCKFMNVNLDFCELNLQLLFTLLQHEKSAKANIIVTVGDLACRYPNAVEPWTHHLYHCLKDVHRGVRKQTLMVLCHLVLNDMVKVKSNISDIVRLIEDYDQEIAGLSKAFFTELAKKSSGNNNPIYNLLPDVLSRLSAENVAQESFRNIMKFMLSFVTKDRHNEKLVEKLCQRFKAITVDCFQQSSIDNAMHDENGVATSQNPSSDTELLFKTNPITQWRDIAYCLTLLPSFNDKCVKKLIECLKEYQHALADQEVFETIRTLGTKKLVSNEKSKKSAGSDSLKQAVEDWEKKIEELHAKLSDDFQYEQHVVEATSKKKKTKQQEKETAPKTPKARRGRKRKVQEWEEEEEKEEEEEEENDSEEEDEENDAAADPMQDEESDTETATLPSNEAEQEEQEGQVASTPVKRITMVKRGRSAKRAKISREPSSDSEESDSQEDNEHNTEQPDDNDEEAGEEESAEEAEPKTPVISRRGRQARRRRRAV